MSFVIFVYDYEDIKSLGKCGKLEKCPIGSDYMYFYSHQVENNNNKKRKHKLVVRGTVVRNLK